MNTPYHLAFIMGKTPMIVTETLYGLMRRGDGMPERISLISTSLGNEACYTGLVEQGNLKRFYDEWGVEGPELTPADLHTITLKDGAEVPDMLTPLHIAAAAEFIFRRVRAWVADDQPPLHLSVAGGRKQMDVFASNAMALSARVCDQVSHVLVSPQVFEEARLFYFPTQQSCVVETYKGEELDCRDAEVILNRVEFPIISDGHAATRIGQDISYTDYIAHYNASSSTPRLRFFGDSENERYWIQFGEVRIDIKRINPDWAFYLWLTWLNWSGVDGPWVGGMKKGKVSLSRRADIAAIIGSFTFFLSKLVENSKSIEAWSDKVPAAKELLAMEDEESLGQVLKFIQAQFRRYRTRVNEMIEEILIVPALAARYLIPKGNEYQLPADLEQIHFELRMNHKSGIPKQIQKSEGLF